MKTANGAEQWLSKVQQHHKTWSNEEGSVYKHKLFATMFQLMQRESQAVADGALDPKTDRELAQERRNAATLYDQEIVTAYPPVKDMLQSAESIARDAPAHAPDPNVTLTRPLDRLAPTWLRELYDEHTKRLVARKNMLLSVLKCELLHIMFIEVESVSHVHGNRIGLHEGYDAQREVCKAEYDAEMQRAPYVEDDLFRRAVTAARKQADADDEPVRVQKKPSSPTLQRPPSTRPGTSVPRQASARLGTTSAVPSQSWRTPTPRAPSVPPTSSTRPASSVNRIWHPPASEYEREHKERAKERELNRQPQPAPIRIPQHQQRSSASSGSPSAGAEGGFAAAARGLSRRPTLSSFNSASRMSGSLSSSFDGEQGINEITVAKPLASNAEEWVRTLHADHVGIFEGLKNVVMADLDFRLSNIAHDEAEASSRQGPSSRVDHFKQAREHAHADCQQQLQSITAIQDTELRLALTQRRRQDREERDALWDFEFGRTEQESAQSAAETGQRRESFWRPPSGTEPISIPTRPSTTTAHLRQDPTSIWRPRTQEARTAGSAPRSQSSVPRTANAAFAAARESLPLFPDSPSMAQNYIPGTGVHGFGRRGIINEDELDVRPTIGAFR